MEYITTIRSRNEVYRCRVQYLDIQKPYPGLCFDPRGTIEPESVHMGVTWFQIPVPPACRLYLLEHDKPVDRILMGQVQEAQNIS